MLDHDAYLLHQAQLFALLLVEADSDSVLLLEALQGQDEQLCVVLVGQRRELDGAELARLQPVHRRGVDGHSLLRRHIRTILQGTCTVSGIMHRFRNFLLSHLHQSTEGVMQDNWGHLPIKDCKLTSCRLVTCQWRVGNTLIEGINPAGNRSDKRGRPLLQQTHTKRAWESGAHLEVVVLALLLSLEVEACQAAQVLATDGLVDGGAAADALAVVVRHIGPPVRLLLHIAQDHVLDGRWQPRHLPGNVRLPAAVPTWRIQIMTSL